MNKEIIITAAVTGSRPTKEMNPAVPYTPAEIINSAVDCWKAGASIAHIHVRDPKTGQSDFKLELFREVLEGIKDKCDMIVNLTTSGLHLNGDFRQRFMPIGLKPEICSLDIGSMNFADGVFYNPPEWSLEAALSMSQNGVKPEIEVFDTGHISQALELIRLGLVNKPYYFQLCMGVKWGIEATEENLLFMKNKLPDCVWGVLGVGGSQSAMISLAMDLGGHVRVGFEDNIYLRKGVPAASNAQLVEMAVEMALGKGRNPTTPEQARKILGLV